jgi:hypothetical protein
MADIKTFLLAGALASILIATQATQQAGSPSGLRMSLAQDEAVSGSDKAMRFTVTFSNVKSEDVTFVPGMLADCGRPTSKTSFITLNLTDSQGNRHRHLPFWGDGPPYQGGTVCSDGGTLFVAVLHPGQAISLPLDIGKYLDLSDSKQYAMARFPAGKYSLQAELTQSESYLGPTKIKYWAGAVSSNILEVRFESEFAAPLSDYPK